MPKKDKHTQKLGMTVTMGRIRRFVEKFKLLNDDDPITFEQILIAFFPNAWHNIQQYSNDCYMEGYLAGRAEGEKNEDSKKV